MYRDPSTLWLLGQIDGILLGKRGPLKRCLQFTDHLQGAHVYVVSEDRDGQSAPETPRLDPFGRKDSLFDVDRKPG
ncbi:hypothetical protein GRJ2_000516800 [Grus japonensis]|uniref:Uncharacterized protein n=1 Tax=Grus japonensis TaxID=30415 RepID=A0ABC9W549_GRUJA